MSASDCSRLIGLFEAMDGAPSAAIARIAFSDTSDMRDVRWRKRIHDAYDLLMESYGPLQSQSLFLRVPRQAYLGTDIARYLHLPIQQRFATSDQTGRRPKESETFGRLRRKYGSRSV